MHWRALHHRRVALRVVENLTETLLDSRKQTAGQAINARLYAGRESPHGCMITSASCDIDRLAGYQASCNLNMGNVIHS